MWLLKSFKTFATKLLGGRVILILGILLSTALIGIVAYLLYPFPENYLEPSKYSLKIFDRNQKMIVELNHYGGLNERFSLEDTPDVFLRLLLFSEDRGFYKHIGIDFKALGRTLVEFVKKGRFVSGGSTITMQLSKLKRDVVKNSLFTKILEILEALKIELHFSKEKILEAYLNEVYLGNNIYGFQKASKVYFGKSLKDLNLAEMSFLIKAIARPSDVYLSRNAILLRARKLLETAYRKGIISEDEYLSSINYNVILNPVILPFSAPHFCFFAIEEAKNLTSAEIEEIHTTLDIDLYNDISCIVRNVIKNLAKFNLSQAGLLLVDNENSEILCMVGSVNYFSEYGANNGVLIKRQPGSTMKAFTYALAFERGIINTSSILPDIEISFPLRYGRYIPRNYDNSFHGPVRVAEALGNSYNIPAVYLLNKIGIYDYISFLKKVGFSSITKSPEFYGLGITLGNADVSLLELVRAYMIFPNNGLYSDLRSIRYVKLRGGKIVYPPRKRPRKVLSEGSCFLINYILSNHKYKLRAFGVNSTINLPFNVAVKTGTSKDFRDNTIIAYNRKYTLGIWAGDFSGKNMINTPSARGAGIILRDTLLYLYNKELLKQEKFIKPSEIIEVEICKLSGMKSSQECDEVEKEVFIAGKQPNEICNWHRNGKIYLPSEYKVWAQNNLTKRRVILVGEKLKILSPHNGSVFAIEESVAREIQNIILEANTESKDVEWFINGKFHKKGNPTLLQLCEGEFTIEARCKNESDRVKITVVSPRQLRLHQANTNLTSD
ncbi:MAG: transglycosylase domain-containing protein [Brevinematia bacterium]